MQTQIAPINFTQGLDTKTDPKLVVPGRLTRLENGVFSGGGSVTKRSGYARIGSSVISGASISSAIGLTTLAGELLQESNGALFSYASGADKMANKGACTALAGQKTQVTRNSSTQVEQDQATLSGITVFAWRDPANAIRVSVLEEATGMFVLTDNALVSSGGFKPRCVAFGGVIAVLWFEPGTPAVKMRTLTPSSPGTWSSTVTISTDAGALNPRLDVRAMLTTSEAVVAWKNGATTISVAKINTSGTITAGPVTVATTNSNCLAIGLSVDEKVHVMTHDGANGLRRIIYTNTLTVSQALGVVDATTTDTPHVACVANGSGALQIWWEVTASNPTQNLVKATILNGASMGSVGTFLRGMGLGTDGFAMGSTNYIGCLHRSELQPTIFIVDASSKMVVGRFLQGLAGNVNNGAWPTATIYYDRTLPKVVDTGSAKMSLALQEQGKISIKSGLNVTPVGISRVLVAAQARQYLTFNSDLYIAGAAPQVYDGNTVAEHGFHLFPERITIAANGAGAMGAGTYQYAACYEWVDARGKIHRSAPSPAVSYTASISTQCNVTIPTLRVTRKSAVNSLSEATIAVFRTQANGTVFYRLTPIATTPAVTALSNDTTVDTVTYGDNATDASIASNEILYTTGGILDSMPMPAGRFAVVHDSRPFVAGLEDPLQFAWGKERSPNYAAEFNENLVGSVPPTFGSLAGIASMDEKLILFAETGIWGMVGQGPNDSGLQGNYTNPEQVTRDTGCTEFRSIVLTPLGLLFLGKKGFYLLDRSLSTKYIGGAIESFNSYSITGVVHLESVSQVRWYTSNGTALVYDYQFDQWSSFTNYAAAAATMWSGNPAHVRSDGSLYKDTPGTYTDNGSTIALLLETSWLAFAGIQGFQRIRRLLMLGTYKAPSTFSLELGYDYADAYQAAVTAATGTVFNDTTKPLQLETHLPIQKCEALRFRISETGGSSPYSGFALSNFALEVGAKQGSAKLGAGYRI